MVSICNRPVSYTHLDVYKRQTLRVSRRMPHHQTLKTKKHIYHTKLRLSKNKITEASILCARDVGCAPVQVLSATDWNPLSSLKAVSYLSLIHICKYQSQLTIFPYTFATVINYFR